MTTSEKIIQEVKTKSRDENIAWDWWKHRRHEPPPRRTP